MKKDKWDGTPPVSDRSGWYWLECLSELVPAQWVQDDDTRWYWLIDGKDVDAFTVSTAGYSFQGPCLTPEQLEDKDRATAVKVFEVMKDSLPEKALGILTCKAILQSAIKGYVAQTCGNVDPQLIEAEIKYYEGKCGV